MWKWCGTCKFWRAGDKAHFTSEHVQRDAPSNTTNNGSATLCTEIGSQSLQLMPSLYMTSVAENDEEIVENKEEAVGLVKKFEEKQEDRKPKMSFFL